jgi:pilus assembly protein Flp/PilA
MERFLIRLRRFFRSEKGPTAVEYAVMLALIVLICLAGINRLGRRTKRVFNQTARSLAS